VITMPNPMSNACQLTNENMVADRYARSPMSCSTAGGRCLSKGVVWQDWDGTEEKRYHCYEAFDAKYICTWLGRYLYCKAYFGCPEQGLPMEVFWITTDNPAH
jgi:hypothetical protein